MLEKLASASVHHRYRTIVIWLAALIGVVVLGGMVTSSVDINDRLDGSDSQRAYDLAAAHMPSVSGLNTAVVFKTNDLNSTAAVIDEIGVSLRYATARPVKAHRNGDLHVVEDDENA